MLVILFCVYCHTVICHRSAPRKLPPANALFNSPVSGWAHITRLIFFSWNVEDALLSHMQTERTDVQTDMRMKPVAAGAVDALCR